MENETFQLTLKEMPLSFYFHKELEGGENV